MERPGTCDSRGMANTASLPPRSATESETNLISLDPLHQALVEFERTAGPEARLAVHSALDGVAAAVAGLPKRHADSLVARQLYSMVRRLGESGVHDAGPAPIDLGALEKRASAPWARGLAMMLVGHAWQLTGVPTLEDLPQWLWPEFARWTLAVPGRFTAPGDTARYAAFVQPRLEEMARLAERNLGSAAVRAVAATVEEWTGLPILTAARVDVRPLAEARTRLLRKVHAREAMPFVGLPFDRHGRKLRVGCVVRAFSDTLANRALLARIAHLDPERFDVVWYSPESPAEAVEAHVRARQQQFIPLAFDVVEAVTQLRDANLDVLTFDSGLVSGTDPVSRLPLFRVAPLQVALGQPVTSGGAEVDLVTVGSEVERPEEFSERLALVPGTGAAYDFDFAQPDPDLGWTRELLGLPEDAFVFVSVAPHRNLTPETQAAWAEILQRVPNSRLLLHPFNAGATDREVTQLSAQFDAVLKAVGLPSERVAISAARFSSHVDVRTLLAVGQLYLDPLGAADPEGAVLALQAGLPVITCEGELARTRTVAAMLRAAGAGETAAKGTREYMAIAAALATDPSRREELQRTLADAMVRVPLFIDPLAASDALGEVLLAAFDAAISGGPGDRSADACRISADHDASIATAQSLFDIGLHDDALGQLTPVLGVAPHSVPLRHLLAKVLAARGQLGRATEYLLAAAQPGTLSAAGWLDLARFLRDGGNGAGAMTALETAIRIDPTNVEGWTMLRDVAAQCGHAEILADVDRMLATLEPGGAGTLGANTPAPV